MFPDKLPQQGKSDLLAFLRVELGGNQIPPLDGTDKITVVIREACGQGWILRNRIVGVHEVEIRIRLLSGPRRISRVGKTDPVPSHVWDLEAGFGRKAHDFTSEDPESGHSGIFMTALKQGLIADTNSKKWPVRPDPLAERFHQSLPPQPGHGIVKPALSRKNEGIHPGKPGRGINIIGLDSGMAQGIPHALQIAAAIVNDAKVHEGAQGELNWEALPIRAHEPASNASAAESRPPINIV